MPTALERVSLAVWHHKGTTWEISVLAKTEETKGCTFVKSRSSVTGKRHIIFANLHSTVPWRGRWGVKLGRKIHMFHRPMWVTHLCFLHWVYFWVDFRWSTSPPHSAFVSLCFFSSTVHASLLVAGMLANPPSLFMLTCCPLLQLLCQLLSVSRCVPPIFVSI